MVGKLRASRDRRVAGDSLADQAGLTIVELLVAFVIMGIVFAGTATALINSSRISVTNEARVQSTALLNRLHEELQALPWDLATLYKYELDAVDTDILAELGIDPSASPPTFEGEPLILAEDPNTTCPTTDPECGRDDLVPAPVATVTDLDGREYDVITIVTRDTDVGDGNISKRFTTIVSWSVLGKTTEQRFQSVRSPVASELEEFGLPSPLFNVTPSVVGLNPEGRIISDIDVLVEFSGPVDSARVEYERLEVDGAGNLTGGVVDQELVLTQVTGAAAGTAWEGAIAALSGPFEVGDLALRMVATRGFDDIVSQRNVLLVDEADLGEAPTVLDTVDALPTLVEVGNASPDTDRLCDDLRVTADVEGLEEFGTVKATFLGDGGVGRDMSVVGSVNPTGITEMELIFPEGSTSLWNPTTASGKGAKAEPAQDVTVTFNVQASNSGGDDSNIEQSNSVTIRRVAGSC